MAAGLGTRLYPFTRTVPKSMVPVFGIPLVEFAVEPCLAAGVRSFVANLHSLPAETESGLKSLNWAGASLSFSDEREKLLGSAGGLKKAEKLLGEGPFFLVNADVVNEVDFAALFRHHERLRAQWGVTITLSVKPVAPGSGKYREILLDTERGLISGIGEPRIGRPVFVSAAVMEAEVLRGLPEDEVLETLPLIFKPAIAAGKAAYFLTDGIWLDVGSPRLWLEAHLELLDRLETGRIAPWIRRKIEAKNRRIGERVWVSERVSPRALRRLPSEALCGPLYLGELPDARDVVYGPRAVWYGHKRSGAVEHKDGIGYGGVWVSTP